MYSGTHQLLRMLNLISIVESSRALPLSHHHAAEVDRIGSSMNDELKSKFVVKSPADFVTMQQATRMLGVSRQTVLQRVKLGKLEAVHICRGKRKGLRIKVLDDKPALFDQFSSTGV